MDSKKPGLPGVSPRSGTHNRYAVASCVLISSIRCPLRSGFDGHSMPMRHGFDPRIDLDRQPFRPYSSGVRLGVAFLELGRITHLRWAFAGQFSAKMPDFQGFQ
jgi:hypothetical protein